MRAEGPGAVTLTALIHTRNEEVHLPDCLRSVAWADEVVVADMASTDATREIARAHGARLVDVPLAPVVEPVRDLAVSQCTGDWVLVVDADERVPPALAERLRELASENGAAAYALPRRNYFLGEWIEHGFWPDHQVRFFRRGTVSWSELVHERPRVEGELRELPPDPAVALEHPGFGNDLGRFLEKQVRYSALDARRLAATVRPPVWPYLLRRPLAEFYGRYVTEQGWRHGVHGLVLSMVLAGYQFLTAAHYWWLVEGSQGERREPRRLRRGVLMEVLRSTAKWLRP